MQRVGVIRESDEWVSQLEVVVGVDSHVGAWQLTSHDSLGVLHVPWGTFKADWVLYVDENLRLLASWLGTVVTLKLHSIKKTLKHGLGSININTWSVTLDGLVEE